jgi:hypothetical protein
MTQKFLFVLILVCLAAIFWLSGKSGAPIYCINSRTVKKIEIPSRGQWRVIPNCSFSYLEEIDGDLKKRYRTLNRFLVKAERFLPRTHRPLTEPRLVVRLDPAKPFRAEWVGDTLMVGPDVFSEKSALEKLLISKALVTKAAEASFAHIIAADAIYAAATGVPLFSDPVNGEEILDTPYINPSWLMGSMSFVEMCRSPWRPIEMFEVCQWVQTVQVSGEFRERLAVQRISFAGYRKYFLELFWKEYIYRSIGERNAFVKKWIQAILKTSDTPLLAKGFSSFAEVRGWMNEFARGLVATGNKWVEKEVSKTQLDMLVFVDKGENRISKWAHRIRKTWSRKKDWVGAIKEEKVYLLPNRQPIVADDFFVVAKAKRLVWETCGGIKIREVVKRAPKQGKVLLAENCEAAERPDYFIYMRDGIKDFAKSHMGQRFWLLNLASLHSGLKWGLSARNRLVFREPTRRVLTPAEKFLGLEKPRFDDSVQAYRVSGVFPIIEWFRAPHGKIPVLE